MPSSLGFPRCFVDNGKNMQSSSRTQETMYYDWLNVSLPSESKGCFRVSYEITRSVI